MFKDDPQFESVWTQLDRNADVVFGREVRVRRLRARADDGADAGGRRSRRSATTRRCASAPGSSTVSDEDMRALDQHLLLDLLKIETRPDAWAGVLDTALIAASINWCWSATSRSRRNCSKRSSAIAKDETSPFTASAHGRRDQAGRRPDGAAPVDVPAEGDRHGVRDRQEACAPTIGPALVKPMSDALMGEDNARTVRRLRDILISFGPAAREYANELKSSRNPAVRRAAIDLLRGARRRRGAARSSAHARRSATRRCSARRCAPSCRSAPTRPIRCSSRR